MKSELKEKLQGIAKNLRKEIVDMVYAANSGHPGGSLSAIDIMTYLFFHEMEYPVTNRDNNSTDRFVLSKGHATPALYSCLAYKGFFDKKDLKGFRQIDSNLQGHPENTFLNGVDVTTGSLGQGFPQAVGMALGLKLDNSKRFVYAMLGDGECQEGLIWEASMSAVHYKLNNLIAFVDHNGLQIDGEVKKVMNVAPLVEKFKAFGWNVLQIDGHNLDEIEEAVKNAKTQKDKPTMVVAITTKGKGVSFMENNAGFHGKAPNDEEYKIAMEELSKWQIF